jgi:hypothetical protein
MEKHFEGDIAGRSATLFTSAFDQAAGVGTYVAMESFEGTDNGRQGAFNFVHSASTTGTDRSRLLFGRQPVPTTTRWRTSRASSVTSRSSRRASSMPGNGTPARRGGAVPAPQRLHRRRSRPRRLAAA